MAGFRPSEHDVYLFHQGRLFESAKLFGAHPSSQDGVAGVRFAVWAPKARLVRLTGTFNDWNGEGYDMHKQGHSGIWTLFVPHIGPGELYKFEIHTRDGNKLLKADPYAFHFEVRPKTASVIYDLSGYEWSDQQWMADRAKTAPYDRPLNIYEVHLGSWRQKEFSTIRKETGHTDTVSGHVGSNTTDREQAALAQAAPDRTNGQQRDVYNKFDEFYTYRELADELVDYAADMGYTHIELLPVMEHPFDGSWGYQGTGYFSVTSRYGTPHDFMYFVDRCHQKGIGVILDWVPGHFARDAHGLRWFDGTPQFEYEDPHKANNPIWGTSHFDLGKGEVISYLISNALFWMDTFHIDGLRVDAVAHMLYLNYGREDREKIYNVQGGEENLEAVQFLQLLNQEVFKRYPHNLMIAEESTDWPLVSAPTDRGGLGFNYKWNMGWMNDVLEYMEMDPIYRRYHHQSLTFSFMYAFSENYVLPFSHDEVVHLKKSMLDKMPGDYWQKFASLRLLYGYMFAHPGKKLIFMGGEFGQFDEWSELKALDWFLLDYDMHKKMQDYVRKLNHFYLQNTALWEQDHSPEGIEWIDADNDEQSIVIFIRKGKSKGDFLLTVANFTPVFHEKFRIGVPYADSYTEVLNSDDLAFGGSGQINRKKIVVERMSWHQRSYSVSLNVPPLGMTVLKPNVHPNKVTKPVSKGETQH
jgi:1,4-alpha-glucan branching enzyme